MNTTKDYVWIWVKNPYAKDNNNQPEKELRRYRVKEYKKNCVVLFDGRQFPYSQIVKEEDYKNRIIGIDLNHAESEDKE